MSRARFFSGIMLALFSFYLGSTLPTELMKAEPQCLEFINKYDHQETQSVARAIYQEAFRLNFDQQWAKAKEASACAGWLDHGSKNWAYEAKNLIN